MLYFPDTLLICSLFFFFMSAVARLGVGVVLDEASGLRTLTSKNVFSKWPPQKPSAAMSDLAPMSVMVVASLKVSLVTGCRFGSMVTL